MFALQDKVLRRLEDNGFTINPFKCKWMVQETDWLGHWLMRDGLKPWRKKVEAVLRLQPPTDVKQVRTFIGSVNYYRDMFPHCSHRLAPLTLLTGKTSFVWQSESHDDQGLSSSLPTRITTNLSKSTRTLVITNSALSLCKTTPLLPITLASSPMPKRTTPLWKKNS
jgi:hypothetical protein